MSTKLVKRALAHLDRSAPAPSKKQGNVPISNIRKESNERYMRELLDDVRSAQGVASERDARAAKLAKMGSKPNMQLLKRIAGPTPKSKSQKEKSKSKK